MKPMGVQGSNPALAALIAQATCNVNETEQMEKDRVSLRSERRDEQAKQITALLEQAKKMEQSTKGGFLGFLKAAFTVIAAAAGALLTCGIGTAAVALACKVAVAVAGPAAAALGFAGNKHMAKLQRLATELGVSATRHEQNVDQFRDESDDAKSAADRAEDATNKAADAIAQLLSSNLQRTRELS